MSEQAALEIRTARLEVTDGPDKGRVLGLGTRASADVGRSTASCLVLSDPLVARRQFAVEVENDGLRLTALEPVSGTRVNGVRVVEALLEGGEEIVVGNSTLSMHVGPTEKVPPRTDAFAGIIGDCAAMRLACAESARLAALEQPIMIEGATATGKMQFAEEIHKAGPRACKAFVVFNCTACPPGEVEQRLFGALDEAAGGTLVIDEIGDLRSQNVQVRLLARLDTGDVRVMATTRRDLERQIQRGNFHQGLYERLAQARLHLPELRRRGPDIERLAEHFWHTFPSLDQPFPSDFLSGLEGYPWPGNVRELYNVVVHRIALLSNEVAPSRSRDRRPLVVDFIDSVVAEDLSFHRARERVLHAFEERYVKRALERFGKNISRAAAASGIARRYFYTIRSRHKR